MYTLYIGNKNYSSWSLRPWLLLKHFGIAFSEKAVQVAGKGVHDGHRPYSANGLVPCLHVDDFQIWDTLAIAEYLNEKHPHLHMWPSDWNVRARARSISAEMHSGFGNLRSSMGMNIKLQLQGLAERSARPEIMEDILRIQTIWEEARSQFAQDQGPYLFGAFSIADAMFAPVVWRFYSFNVTAVLSETAKVYMQTMLAHPAMQAWRTQALAETTALAHYDAQHLADYGPQRPN